MIERRAVKISALVLGLLFAFGCTSQAVKDDITAAKASADAAMSAAREAGDAASAAANAASRAQQTADAAASAAAKAQACCDANTARMNRAFEKAMGK